MPHAEALERARVGRASHGLCPACLPLAVKEWDAAATEATDAADQAAARVSAN